ncbi:hypothetical protein BGZ83_005200 [Gryganskiella cystojenkinii]|nr:hypothetical protein BGZ83_005200 [Gryganskiella cystojenkinii]
MTLTTSTVLQTTKHNLPAPPTKIQLHGLDLLNPPIQIHNHRFFRRPSKEITAVVEKLKSSLAEALELYPPVAGTVQSTEQGKIFVATDKDAIVGTPFLVDLKDTPYENDSEDLSPRTEVILAPKTAILAVKVTVFSCGTVCVASSLHHQVADLRGFLDFLELWSGLCRNEPVDFTRIPDDWTRTPGRFFSELMPKSGGLISPPPPFTLLDTPQLAPPAFLMAPSVVTNWKITKDAMEQMKKDFSPPSADLWISSGDALAAILAGTITRARQGANVRRLEGRSTVESGIESIAMAADGRERSPKRDMAGGHYFGNFNNLWSLTVSREDLNTATGEAAGRVALAIRSGLDTQLSAEAVAKRVAFFDQPEINHPPGRVAWSADVILTNWCRFDLKGPKLDMGWGHPFEATSGGATVFPPAYCLMYQDKATGDTFVLMTIEQEGETLLKSDPLMTTYGSLISA